MLLPGRIYFAHAPGTLEIFAKEAKPPAAGGLGSGGRASRAQNFCIFLQNELNFRAILIENNAFRTWHKNWQPNMIQPVALMGYMRSG